VWQGYAADPEIRFKASSGGAATALALFCLDRQYASGVLHTGIDPEVAWQNVPAYSTRREELVSRTGSRYSPAAPCEKLDWLEEAKRCCVVIGKPCDIAALRKSQVVDGKFHDKVSLAISIFCAGTPSTEATYALLNKLAVEPMQVQQLRYRGHGWPGMTTVRLAGDDRELRTMSYAESWGNILSRHRQLRCHLCPDGTGEFADISCGDAWHLTDRQDDPGQSLLLVRTERGRDMLHEAMAAGYLELKQVDAHVLGQSQGALLRRRRHLWGRLLVLRLAGIPVPKYRGFSLFTNWGDLSLAAKARSLLGTAKRIIRRKLYMPVKLHAKSARTRKTVPSRNSAVRAG
jgi:coenzyme F420 hydrogenase subunit beta